MLPVVSSVRCYPVKSMGGTALDAADVDARGLAGDRWFAVVDEEGLLASGKDSRRFRRRDPVFGYTATVEGGEVWVRRGDRRWRAGDPAADRELCEATGVRVRLLPEAEVPHQDAGQVSLVGTASLRWCRENLGVDADPRRLRVNLVVETAEPFVEETWIGSALQVGGAVLQAVRRIDRCRMIDLAQDGAEAAAPWLAPLVRGREGCMGVYADVRVPGRVAVGDVVRAV